jgi:hypothetical protein
MSTQRIKERKKYEKPYNLKNATKNGGEVFALFCSKYSS